MPTQPTQYPVRPIRLIVPFAPGGTVDILARVIGARLSEMTGQQVVVDNRGGGGGVIGTQITAQSRGDGYTLLLHSAAIAYEPALHSMLPYDTVKDLAPVTLVGSTPNLLVANAAFPAKSARDLIAMAKEKPGSHHLRHRRHRQRISSRRRALQQPVGHDLQPHSVQRRGTRADGARRRAGEFHDRDHARRDPACQGRTVAGARHFEPQALSGGAGRSDHCGNRPARLRIRGVVRAAGPGRHACQARRNISPRRSGPR